MEAKEHYTALWDMCVGSPVLNVDVCVCMDNSSQILPVTVITTHK